MGLSVTKFPSIISPVRNPAVFELTTDLSEGGLNAVTTIAYPRDERLGAVYYLIWNNDQTTVQLECVETPDMSGNQFPVRRGELFIDWLMKVVDLLKLNTVLATDFDIKVSEGGNSIIMQARNPGLAYTMTYNLFNCEAQIFVEAGADGKEKENLKFGLRVCRRVNGQDTSSTEDLFTPSQVNGLAVGQIDVAEILHPALSCGFTVQSFGYPAIISRNETCLPYYVQYYEQYGETPNIVQVYTSRWFYSLHGGVPPWLQVDFFKVYHSLNQYFNTTNRFFLTWHWFHKITDTQAPERLYMVVPRQPLTTNFLLKVTRHFYDDGDEIVYFNLIASLSLGQVWEIDVSYGSLVGAFVENLIGYDVEVVSQDMSYVSAPFSLTIDTRTLPHVRYFMFLNTLGGYECARFTGETIHERSFARDYFDRATLSEYDETLIPRSQLPPETTRSFKVNTGWISKETVDWMQDFLNSTEVFEIKGNNRYPVVIVQDKIELMRDSVTLYSITITMEYADFPCVFQKEVDVPWEDVSQIEDPYQQD